MAAGVATAAAAAGAPAMAAPDKANKPAEPPARPAPVQKHYVELTSTPPQPHRETAPPPARPGRNAVVCFKTAARQCDRVE